MTASAPAEVFFAKDFLEVGDAGFRSTLDELVRRHGHRRPVPRETRAGERARRCRSRRDRRPEHRPGGADASARIHVRARLLPRGRGCARDEERPDPDTHASACSRSACTDERSRPTTRCGTGRRDGRPSCWEACSSPRSARVGHSSSPERHLRSPDWSGSSSTGGCAAPMRSSPWRKLREREAEKEGFEPSRQGFPHLTP